MANDKLRSVAFIPAYNEEHTIAKVILGTRQHVDNVIVCDDGSTDMTFNIAQALGAKVVRHDARRGKGEALRTLAKEVFELSPVIIVTLDADGQHNPDDIPMLLKPIEAGKSDLVVGSRYVSGGGSDAPIYRRLGLHMINFLYRQIAGVQVKDTQSGFRAYSPKALEYMMQSDAKGYGIESEQLVSAAKNGLKVTEVPISVNYNGLVATSKQSPLSQGVDLISTLFRLVVEDKPLKYLGLPGVGLTFVGILMALYSLWMFNMTRCFSILEALFTIGTLIVGPLLLTSGIILQGLKGINEKLNRFNKYEKK